MVGRIIKAVINNTVIRMLTALSIVGAVAGASLVFVYNYATPKIEVNVEGGTEKAIKTIFPDVGKIKQTGEKDVYKIENSQGEIEGYAFLAEGNGYQGTIKLIIGVDPKIDKMMGMEVLESQETPGLGAEISSAHFRDQFIDLPVTKKIEYVKNQKLEKDNQIEAITGATISSKAVVRIINNRIEELRQQGLGS